MFQPPKNKNHDFLPIHAPVGVHQVHPTTSGWALTDNNGTLWLWDTIGTPWDAALVATDRRGARGVRIWLDVLRMIHAIAGLAKFAHSLYSHGDGTSVPIRAHNP